MACRHVLSGLEAVAGLHQREVQLGWVFKPEGDALDLDGKGGGNYVDCKDISGGFQKYKYLLAAPSLRRRVASLLWERSNEMILAHSP